MTTDRPTRPTPLTPDAYLAEVAHLLRTLPERDRDAALDDLRDALAETVGPTATGDTSSDPTATDPTAAFGTPAQYAEEVLRTVAPPRDPDAPEPAQATVLGMPTETRGPVDARVRARVWDPTNPTILVPRLFGAGWTVNLGAVAVRLGLIRPDDYDDEVLDLIPPAVTTAARVAPLVVTAAGAAAVAARWRSLPSRVPTHFGFDGRADGFGPRAVAALPTVVSTAVAAWAAAPTRDAEDRLIRPSIAAATAVVAGSITAATLTSATVPRSRAGLLVPAAIPVAGAAALASLVVPVRAGLTRVWSRAGSGQTPMAPGAVTP